MHYERWHVLTIHISLLIALCLCSCLAIKRAMAIWYARRGTPDGLRAAVKWDPGNPQYYDALATFMHLYADGDDWSHIVPLYETATHLSPSDAQLWADLGAGYDWAGRTDDAFRAFEHAHDLFPNSPDINWRLANFCIRTSRISEGLRALRIVLEGDSTARTRVFSLATNATRNTSAILDILPLQAPAFFDYLGFEVQRGDIAAAAEIWARVLQLGLPFELREAFPYLDALIQHRELDQLAGAWSALVERFPEQIARRVPGSNLITNGDFESHILNGGLDWRVVPTIGAAVSLESADTFDGSRALRISFEGSRNLDYGHVFQYVPVRPNTVYRFSAYMRVRGISTDSGPRFQVCDAYNMADLSVSTENLVGTSGWSEQHSEFTTGPDNRLLIIRVARPLSRKLDNRIVGDVWIDHVSLTADP
jgi:hypothetical protein